MILGNMTGIITGAFLGDLWYFRRESGEGTRGGSGGSMGESMRGGEGAQEGGGEGAQKGFVLSMMIEG